MGDDGKVLTTAQIEQFRELGFCSPVSVLTVAQALEVRSRLEAHEAALGEPIGAAQRSKSHYLFTWVDDLMRNERIAVIPYKPQITKEPFRWVDAEAPRGSSGGLWYSVRAVDAAGRSVASLSQRG